MIGELLEKIRDAENSAAKIIADARAQAAKIEDAAKREIEKIERAAEDAIARTATSSQKSRHVGHVSSSSGGIATLPVSANADRSANAMTANMDSAKKYILTEFNKRYTT